MAWRRGHVAVAAAAVLGAVAARAIAWGALRDVPHVMDEIAYVFQARVFGAGHLAAPAVSPRGAFALWFVEDRAWRFAVFPPGWPALLAVARWLGLQAWLGPTLHAATVALVGASAHRLGGARARVAAAVLYAFSPQALVLAASLMPHTAIAFAASGALWGGLVLAGRVGPGRAARGGAALAAGVGLGVAAATRPLCALAIALGLLAPGLVAARRGRLGRGVVAAVVGLAAAGVVALGAFNHALTGSATRFPQTAWFEEHEPPYEDPLFAYRPGCNALGIGPTHGCDRAMRAGYHDLENAVSNTGDNLSAWFFLVGPVTLALAGLGCAARPTRRRVLPILVTPAAAVVLYALYWYGGTCYGARFYHAGLPALVAAAGVGVAGLVRRGWRARPRARLWVSLVAMGWVGSTAGVLRGAVGELAAAYWGTDERFVAMAEAWTGPPALMMVAFAEPAVPMQPMRWTGITPRDGGVWHNSVRALAALGANPPGLDGRLLFAKFHPALAPALRARFADRVPYLYVVHRDRSEDTFGPYRAEAWREAEAQAPPPVNFDGYVKSPGTGDARGR